MCKRLGMIRTVILFNSKVLLIKLITTFPANPRCFMKSFGCHLGGKILRQGSSNVSKMSCIRLGDLSRR